MNQRAAQAEFLLHATGELARGPVHEVVKPGGLGQALAARGALFGALVEKSSKELQILDDTQVRIEVLAQPLRHIGDARPGPVAVGAVGHVAAEHRDTAGLDFPCPGDQP